MTKSSDMSLLALPVAIVLAGAVVAALVAVGLPLTFLWAYVLSHLWGWFIVPAFGLPALQFWNAVGVCLIASCFTHSLAKESGKDQDASALRKLAVTFVASAMGALIMLGLGYWFSGYVS